MNLELYSGSRMIYIKKIVFTLVIAVSFAACSHSPRVIPKSEIENIYAEMLLMDQWISVDWNNTFIADTSLVYEPILKKHGYSLEDYYASVDYYLNDPDKFSKIFTDINKRFTDKVNEIEKEEKLKAKLDSIKNIPVHDFDVKNFTKILTLPYHDTVKFILDSSGRYIIKLSVLDTLFEGPKMLVLIDSTNHTAADSLKNISAETKEK